MTPTLSGLRVLDLSWGTAGAVATMLLSDHGAEVIKVEPPGGDPFRAMPGYTVWNRGKKSAVLDLTLEGDREVLRALAHRVDVVIESFSPGVADHLGIGYESLRPDNQRLIHCSITGYGSSGPSSSRSGYDALVQARSGLQYEQPGLREGPIFLRVPLPSFGAALLAAVGISAALRAREVTGSGQRVETSLAQGSLLWTTQIWKRASRPTAALSAMWENKDLGPTPCFEDSEGQWFHPMVNGVSVALAHLGRPPDELDVATIMTGDRASRQEFFEQARDLFKQRPRDEWVALFEEHEIPCQPVQPPGPVFEHPQVVHTGAVTTVEVPGMGPVVQLGHTYHLEHHPDVVQGPPPSVDQHRGEILDVVAGPPPGRPAPTGRPLRHALEGIRVLDLGTAVAGPFGTMLLGDLGAEVIKVEPVSAAVGTPGDATWVCGARGKRCIAVNLKSAEGQEILRRLIATVDVLHYNLRPGVAERLGFGYEEARKLNPRLVFCHLTAYGSTGPLAGKPGTDQMAQALCGLEYEQGAASSGGHPTWYRFGMTDAVSGALSALGVIQALYRREQTGQGQAVETDILSAGMLLASDEFIGPAGLVRRTPLDRRQTGLGPYYRLYETRQGWICIAAVGPGHQERLHRLLGLPTGSTVTSDALEAAFEGESAMEWQRRLDAAGVPCEVAREQSGTWCDDPHAKVNEWVASYDHPVWGRLEQPGEFVRLSETPGWIRGAPPIIGQHTEEVLREIGYQDAEIAQLDAQGVVGVSPGSRHPR